MSGLPPVRVMHPHIELKAVNRALDKRNSPQQQRNSSQQQRNSHQRLGHARKRDHASQELGALSCTEKNPRIGPGVFS